MALMISALGMPVHAVTPAVLVDRSLDAQPVRVTVVADGQITFFDAERRLQRAALDHFVQLRAIGASTVEAVPSARVPTGRGAVLVLIDGQRLAGRWAGAPDEAAGEDSETLAWEHPMIGRVAVALDRVRGWGQAQPVTEASVAVARQGPPTQDRVVLTNGDVIHGFVVGMTETGVSVQPDGAGEPIALAADRVAKVMLANPQAPPEPEHQTLVLRDGSVLAVTDLALRREQVTFRPALGSSSESVALSVEQVARIDFTASGRRLVSLSDLPREVSGGEVFGLPMRPWMEAEGSLRLHAPVTVTFELPAGARRLAGVAELALGSDAPPELLDWADFELTIDASRGEPIRHRLYADNRAVVLNLPLLRADLRLTLKEGANGPVLDRLRLRHAVVLIDPEDEADAQASAPGSRRIN